MPSIGESGMLCLNKADIEKAISRPEVIESVETALRLYESKEFMMPLRMHAAYQGNTLLLMPCFTETTFGTKLVSLFPENPKRGFPLLYGTMVLNDGRTGRPIALLDGPALTALRTGAVGSVGICHLTPENVKKIGVVGAGVQGFYQALFACEVRSFSDIYIYDRFPEKSAGMAAQLETHLPGKTIHIAQSVEEILEETEVIITATTSAEPVLPDRKDLLDGKHFIAIGSFKPAMRELPESLFRLLDRMFIDTDHAREETGDVMVPVAKKWIEGKRILTLGSILTERERGIGRDRETTLFKSVGMALFDVVVAEKIFRLAESKNVGQKIIF